ncbi:MAG: hypothetical protein U0326_15840 [Polyangiales bacterium]
MQLHRRVSEALHSAQVCSFGWYQEPPPAPDLSEEEDAGEAQPSDATRDAAEVEQMEREDTWIRASVLGLIPSFDNVHNGVLALDVSLMAALSGAVPLRADLASISAR